MACALMVGCGDGPTEPARTITPPPISNPPAQEQLAGAYDLTLNVSEQCTAIPESARTRNYRATLDQSRYAYSGVRLDGGGFANPVTIGDMWPGQNGEVTLTWNYFDLDFCGDVYPEPLPDGSTLIVCGSGVGLREGSTISGMLNAKVWIEEGGRRGPVCLAGHRFTFVRRQ